RPWCVLTSAIGAFAGWLRRSAGSKIAANLAKGAAVSTRRILPHRIPLVVIAIVIVLGGLRPASAVPVFARKYQTSCQTCHTVFPKLNPFGQSFRLNGYRMPAETEEQVKEKPLSLGSEAYKRTWPSMVYPSTIPATVPVAI